MAQSTPKGMSSRLLTMKFMQRSAAASPASSSPSTPKTNEQSAKRRKVSHGSSAKVDADSLVDQKAIQAAMEEGERKREEALVKHAAELGDARWVLDVPQNMSSSAIQARAPLNVVQEGFAQIDSSEASGDDTGSQNFRRYNMDKKKEATAEEDSASESDSSNSSDSSEDGSPRKSYNPSPKTPSGGSNKANNGLQQKRSAEKARAKELAEKRRKKEIKLNKPSPGGLMSISSGGLSTGGGMTQRQVGEIKCFKCGKPGHKAPNCKNK